MFLSQPDNLLFMKTKTYDFIRLLGVVTLLLVIFNSCKKDTDEVVILPSFSSVGIASENLDSVVVGTRISAGNTKIITCGICWSEEHNPTILDNKIVDSTATDSLTFTLYTYPFFNKTYYVRAYLTSSNGTIYSQEVSFTLWMNYLDESVTDYDGNTYSTVRIGNQTWMTENLKVTHYANGDPIPQLSLDNDAEWLTTTSGAYCDYADNSDNGNTYGHLYNWYAVNDARGICPAGWHVPSKEEWETLINYLGGVYVAGGNLKATGTQYWKSPNYGATNVSGFNGLPCGIRSSNISSPSYTYYVAMGYQGYWWIRGEYGDAPYSKLYYATAYSAWSSSEIFSDILKIGGIGVRCVKD